MGGLTRFQLSSFTLVTWSYLHLPCLPPVPWHYLFVRLKQDEGCCEIRGQREMEDHGVASRLSLAKVPLTNPSLPSGSVWGGGLVTRDMEALLLPSHRGSLQAELCSLVMPTRP